MATATDTTLDLGVIEDDSIVAEGFTERMGSLVGTAGKFLGSVLRASQRATILNMALSMFQGIIVSNTRNADGSTPWNLGNAPEVVQHIRDAIIAESGLDEAEARAIWNAGNVRAQWNRVVRPAFFQSLALAAIPSEDLAKIQYGETHKGWSKALSELPEELRELLPESIRESYAPAVGFPASYKREMASLYKSAGLDVPEVYGGPSKSKNEKGTKDKNAASVETVLQSLASEAIPQAGTDGGSSDVSVTRGILAVTSAYALHLIGPADGPGAAFGEIAERDQVREYLTRAGTVLSMAVAALEGQDVGAEAFSAVAFDPKHDK